MEKMIGFPVIWRASATADTLQSAVVEFYVDLATYTVSPFMSFLRRRAIEDNCFRLHTHWLFHLQQLNLEKIKPQSVPY